MLGQVLVTQGQAEKAIQLVARSSARMADDPNSQALAASVIAQAHTARGDGEAAQDFARKALTLAAGNSPPQAVAMLVAQGAFAAGLKEEATALVRDTISDAPVRAVGALARKVLADAGLRPEAFAQAAQPVSPVLPSQPVQTQADTRPAQETGDRPRPVSADLEAALEALHHARFDEALGHVEQARRRAPANSLVLMTAVQVYMMSMHARGFDPDTAREVRRCLGEVDRQIPGARRVFSAQTSSDALK
jgi:tetratricopeptide (TPR) repeat protein